jgi:LacI family transcriptional regulator
MQSNGIEGLLITPALLNDPNVEELIREGFPVLLLFRRVNRRSLKEQIGYVGVDNRHGGYIGVEHLIRLGHSNIVLFSGPLTSSESLEWIDGAKEAFLTYGVNWDKANVLTMDPSKKSGYEGAKRFLESPKRPSAFFVMGDWVAFGVYEAILEMGLRIPEDVALVGFNDIEFTSLRSISMTTLGQKHYELGVFAAGTLVEKIEGRGDSFTKEIVFKPKLLVRSTCGFSISGYRREAVLKESAEVLLETILID